jgi:hypothetical protein
LLSEHALDQQPARLLRFDDPFHSRDSVIAHDPLKRRLANHDHAEIALNDR